MKVRRSSTPLPHTTKTSAPLPPWPCWCRPPIPFPALAPGARKELLENYVKRLEDLEGIATSFSGVSKAYAIQAGREIRVMVNSDQVDDDATYLLCKDIAAKIEKNLTYPGQIRVTVIRERRAVELAK